MLYISQEEYQYYIIGIYHFFNNFLNDIKIKYPNTKNFMDNYFEKNMKKLFINGDYN